MITFYFDRTKCVQELCVPKKGSFYIGGGMGTDVLPETHVNNCGCVPVLFGIQTIFRKRTTQ